MNVNSYAIFCCQLSPNLWYIPFCVAIVEVLVTKKIIINILFYTDKKISPILSSNMTKRKKIFIFLLYSTLYVINIILLILLQKFSVISQIIVRQVPTKLGFCRMVLIDYTIIFFCSSFLLLKIMSWIVTAKNFTKKS